MFRSMLRQGRRIASGRKSMKPATQVALFEAVEGRRLMSATLQGLTTYSINAETNSAYGANGYLAVSGTANGSGNAARTRAWGFLEYNSTSSVFPNKPGNTFQVSDINSFTISLYNTATSGTYAPTPGNFSVYFAPDDSAAPTNLRWQAADALNGVNGQLGINSTYKIGTASFGGSLGYSDYSFSSLPASVKQGIVNDLNNGTPLRLAIVPETTTFFADWEGNYTVNQPKLSLNVEQAVVQPAVIGFDAGSYSVNKDAGTATFTVTRQIGTGFTDTGASISYATSDLTGHAGTNYSATSGVLNFTAGQTSKTITVPIIDPGFEAQHGDKTFKITLSNAGPAGQAIIANGQAAAPVVTIVDSDAVHLSENSVDNATVQPGGPKAAPAGKTYFNIEGSSNGINSSYGVLDYNVPGSGSEYSLPGGTQISTINSITLETVAGFPTQAWYTSGKVDVYIVSDTQSSIQADGSSPLSFDLNSSPDGLGDQLGTKLLIGSLSYDRSQALDVFTPYDLTNGNQAAIASLIAAINSGSQFRIAVTPGDDTVAAGWEGQYTFNGEFEAPKLTISAYTNVIASLPSWVAPGSEASWNAGSKTLTVTGPTTIIADPGSDNPVVNASGASAVVTINPFSDKRIHLAGLNLSSGATADVLSVGAGRTASNHRLLSVDSSQFSLDATSKLDLEDNDLVLRSASAATETTVGALITAANNGGSWTGNGITSSKAAATGSTALGYALNDGSDNVSFSTFGPGESVSSSDMLIKYTHIGDADLSGTVTLDDYAFIDLYYPTGSNSSWTKGDFDYSGSTTLDDYAYIDLFFPTTDVL